MRRSKYTVPSEGNTHSRDIEKATLPVRLPLRIRRIYSANIDLSKTKN
jgi:hypothetical protein